MRNVYEISGKEYRPWDSKGQDRVRNATIQAIIIVFMVLFH